MLGHKSFSMTLRYAHPSPMHLQTAMESLNGLTPDAAQLDRWAHKMAQNRKKLSEQEVVDLLSP